ncbi:MAG: hypothetical protein CMI53_04095 [Parcubacteria group bacterium]|jgi:hypothetical protein|nr:hypothetical protein [Parcubacteria group bacterium]|tara:strand:+ start:3645 stop:3884 length:240 start_codon:yes stop_codon:yes gene_type:complete
MIDIQNLEGDFDIDEEAVEKEILFLDEDRIAKNIDWKSAVIMEKDGITEYAETDKRQYMEENQRRRSQLVKLLEKNNPT